MLDERLAQVRLSEVVNNSQTIDQLKRKTRVLGVSDLALVIFRETSKGKRFVDHKKSVKEKASEISSSIYRNGSEVAFDVYYLVTKDLRGNLYCLTYPLLEVSLHPKYSTARINAQDQIQDLIIDPTLRPKNLGVVEYVRNALLLEAGKTFIQSGNLPTLWTSREGIPTNNFTNTWQPERLAEDTERKKAMLGEYKPNLNITERLIKAKEGVLALPDLEDPSFFVSTLLERRAMGYGNPEPIAA